ncbi:MAG: TolC family protein [Ekhidna sp.]|uniref:TolC family protein n=1 Tax=Ekhidna sp. TaxID=2608089 RepID=UPI0032EB8EAA
MDKKQLIAGVMVLAVVLAKGQDTLMISKTQLLEQVAAENHQIRIAEMQAEMAGADYQQSNSLYLPQVSASYTGITTNNPLMAFGSKLNQEILTQADFNPALLNDPDNVENFATEILILQPLLNLDGVYGRNAAKIQKEAYELKTGRMKEYLELEAVKWYMQLQLAYEAVQVLERAVQTSQEALDMITDYYDQGMLQKADLLDVQVRANEVQNQLRYAKSNVQNTSDQLAILLGERPGLVTYKPEERAAMEYEQSSFPMMLPEGRKDLLAMNKSVQGYESLMQSSRMKFLPRINAFGSFQLYDNQPLGFDASGYVIGAKLSWDIFKGYTQIAQANKAKIEALKARVEQEQYSAQQQAELSKANRMFLDALEKIASSELAFDQASEAYKVRKDRFEQGLEKTSDLLTAETQMFNKELEFRQAVFEYNFSKEYLHFLTRQ